MQLIPTTARRFGVNDVFNPQQNIDGGVHYLKTLLDRYNGNLDMALAAYNAGEGRGRPGAWDSVFPRKPATTCRKFRAPTNQPGSGRLADAVLFRPRPIHRDMDLSGRTIFSNE